MNDFVKSLAHRECMRLLTKRLGADFVADGQVCTRQIDERRGDIVGGSTRVGPRQDVFRGDEDLLRKSESGGGDRKATEHRDGDSVGCQVWDLCPV